MLHSVIDVSKQGDMTPPGSPARPLNARSLALSALLGSHPPTLPARGLVALAETFGIQAGTMRTALSRLVAAGDVTALDGTYTLAPRLVARQAAQDTGRRRAHEPWHGEWHTAVATVDHRDLADRRQVRVTMANARFGELRPTIWLRPANLALPQLGGDWLVTSGRTHGTTHDELVARLWDLAALERAARALLERLEQAATDGETVPVPIAFSLSAEIVRFLRTDPLLPHELTPRSWPLDQLRDRYDAFERALQRRLRPILTG